jgi:hypothetical protein
LTRPGERHRYGVAVRTWVGDLDSDGDIDLCTKPWSDGNQHIFLENRLRHR